MECNTLPGHAYGRPSNALQVQYMDWQDLSRGLRQLTFTIYDLSGFSSYSFLTVLLWVMYGLGLRSEYRRIIQITKIKLNERSIN